MAPVNEWRQRLKAAHPIWDILRHQGRSLKWLADRSEYNPKYVRGIACGWFPAAAEFRQKCARVMDLPESVLFLPAPPSTGASDSTGTLGEPTPIGAAS